MMFLRKTLFPYLFKKRAPKMDHQIWKGVQQPPLSKDLGA